MGAWSHTSFGNDDALDFLYEAEESGAAAVTAALSCVANAPADEYLEAPDCSAALAAAELVAAAQGNPPNDFPDEANAISKTLQFSPDIRIIASAAAKRILAKSELRELWEETGDFGAWQQDVKRLIDRLK